jgi:hypothetical protein
MEWWKRQVHIITKGVGVGVSPKVRKREKIGLDHRDQTSVYHTEERVYRYRTVVSVMVLRHEDVEE